MAHATLTLQTPTLSIADLRSRIDQTDKRRSVRAFITLLFGIVGGAFRGMVRVQLSDAVASQTITVSQAGAVNGTDELTIAGTVLAVEASPANESEFLKGASNAAFAANAVACINAHSVLQKIVRAKVTGAATFAVYSLVPGLLGNLITLAESGNGFTLGGAALAGGTSDEMDNLELGYDPAA